VALAASFFVVTDPVSPASAMCSLAQTENRHECFVDSPLLFRSNPADQVSQTAGIDRAHFAQRELSWSHRVRRSLAGTCEYKARSSPALEFRDRELVELLQGFTRPAEQPVPLGFWEKDLAVMRAVEDVAVALHQAPVLVSPGP